MALVSTLVASKSAPNGVVSRANGYISGTYTAATVNSATAASTTAAATGGIANADAVHNMVIAAGVMTITLGFIPKYFKIINVTDRLTQEWFEGMNTGDFPETASNGDKTLETDDKVTITTSLGSSTRLPRSTISPRSARSRIGATSSARPLQASSSTRSARNRSTCCSCATRS